MYLLFSPFIKNFYLLLLVCGFFKHFLGSSFGIWSWYCNNGEACLKVLSQDQNYEANTLYLIRESIYESILLTLIIGVSILIIENLISININTDYDLPDCNKCKIPINSDNLLNNNLENNSNDNNKITVKNQYQTRIVKKE
jgi:hypothetical protein